MSETQPNIPLLRKAVEWAEAEAAKPPVECRWFQGDYVMSPAARAEHLLDEEEIEVSAEECGTCFCIAGYVGQMVEPGYREDWIYEGVDVHDRALNELGLTGSEADRLFDGGNSIKDVRRIAEDIAGERL